MGRYMVVRLPDHPRAGRRSGAVLEHIVIAEQALGHYLMAPAQVHHIDENPLNNDPSNLVICQDQAYHKLLHRRMDALRATGNPNALTCNVCGQYDLPENMRVFVHSWRGRPNAKTTRAYHRSCKKEQVARSQSTLAASHRKHLST
jgi:hypothetical protein